MNVDSMILNGRVIDPESGTDDVMDVALKGQKVFALGRHLDLCAATTFDATGCIVTPGLIDAHVHCYEYATPLGVNPDEYFLRRGVTTVIDAGSAGASTFMGLRKYVIDRSNTRIRCLLHIAQHGLAAAGLASGGCFVTHCTNTIVCSFMGGGGESDTLAVLNEEDCLTCIQNNSDVILGVKVRLTAEVCDLGRNENEAYKRALSVAAACRLPLMTHHTVSTIPTQKSQDPGAVYGCPADLRTGDIYTHSFHGYPSCIIDAETRKIHDDVLAAKRRGVLFDVGHGAGSFNWTVAEIALKNDFYPDMLGTDLHTMNIDGPAYDLPTVMTKFLHLGMPLQDIVKAATLTPAQAYNLSYAIGSLAIGKDADVTVSKIIDCDVMLEDTCGQLRHVTKRIVPVSVWRAGKQYEIKLPATWPSPKAVSRNLEQQIIKD